MRRHLLIIAILLLAGALANVAVAWACTGWSHSLKSKESKTNASIDELRWLLRIGREATPNTDYWIYEIRKRDVRGFGFVQQTFGERRFQQGDGRSFYGPASSTGDFAVRIHAGWPMHALAGHWRARTGAGTVTAMRWHRSALVIVPWGATQKRALPLHPIWPGFAANTLIYAAALWLLFWSALASRRLIRRRRGLCPACAYPMGESEVCTECGRELPARKITS